MLFEEFSSVLFCLEQFSYSKVDLQDIVSTSLLINVGFGSDNLKLHHNRTSERVKNAIKISTRMSFPVVRKRFVCTIVVHFCSQSGNSKLC